MRNTRNAASNTSVFAVFPIKTFRGRNSTLGLLANQSAVRFRASFSGDTRNAVSRLWISLGRTCCAHLFREIRGAPSSDWISWRQRYFAHFFLELRGTPSPNWELHVAHGISRNPVEEYERCRLQTRDFALPIIFRVNLLRYDKCRPQTVDFALSIVFRAISLRNTRNAVSKLWISRRTW